VRAAGHKPCEEGQVYMDLEVEDHGSIRAEREDGREVEVVEPPCRVVVLLEEEGVRW